MKKHIWKAAIAAKKVTAPTVIELISSRKAEIEAAGRAMFAEAAAVARAKKAARREAIAAANRAAFDAAMSACDAEKSARILRATVFAKAEMAAFISGAAFDNRDIVAVMVEADRKSVLDDVFSRVNNAIAKNVLETMVAAKKEVEKKAAAIAAAEAQRKAEGEALAIVAYRAEHSVEKRRAARADRREAEAIKWAQIKLSRQMEFISQLRLVLSAKREEEFEMATIEMAEAANAVDATITAMEIEAATIEMAEAANVASTIFDEVEAEKGVNFMFDLQLFAAMRNPSVDNVNDEDDEMPYREVYKPAKERIDDSHGHVREIVEALKNHRGNMMVPVITPVDSKSNGFHCVLSTASVPVSAITGPYSQKGVAMASAALGRFMTVANGTNDIVVVNLAGIAKEDDDQFVNFFTDRPFYLVFNPNQVDGEAAANVMVESDDGNFVIVSGNNADHKCPRKALYADAAMTRLKPNVIKFDKAAAIYSTSQGRKVAIMFFRANTDEDVKRFADLVDDAMVGELAKAEGREMSLKAIVDSNNRISGRLCGAGATKDDGFVIPNEVIVFKAGEIAANTDGMYFIDANALARAMVNAGYDGYGKDKLAKLVEGYLIQSRPYGIKAAGLVISSAQVAMKLTNMKIYDLHVDKLTKDEQEAMDIMLNKALRGENGVKLGKPDTFPEPFKNYDAVRVIRDENAPMDGIVANLNAHKNHIDLTMVDGLNVLNVAHFDNPDGNYLKTFTSGQFLKIFEMALKDAPAKVAAAGRKALRRIMKRQIAFDTQLNVGSIKGLGHEMIDTSYPAGIIRAINPSLETLTYVPGIYRGIINDTVKRINNTINRDRYAVAGHSGMLTADVGYVLTGSRILEANDKFIEVYDPVWEKYAKERGLLTMKDGNRGIGIKYPAMGCYELLFIKFVTLDEIEERIADAVEAGKIAEDNAMLVFNAYKTFKYGGVMIPAYLDVIAEIAAGLDLDGDKLCIMFVDVDSRHWHYDFVKTMFDAKVSWRAVHIVPEADETKETAKYSLESYAMMLQKNIAFGNHGVGQVTNAMAVFSNAFANDLSDDAWRFYTALFTDVFVKSRKDDRVKTLVAGSKDYESQVEVAVTEDGNFKGLKVYTTSGDIVDRIEDAIYEMKMTRENISAALSDLDVLGRHLQELTIDAQKKFYHVACEFIDRMHGFALLNKREWVEIAPDFENGDVVYNMVYNGLEEFVGGYTVDEETGTLGVTELASAINVATDNVVNILADAFADYRVMAFNYAADKIHEMVATYQEMICSDDKPFDMLAADKAVMANGELRGEIAFYSRLITTARSMYRNKEHEIVENINNPYDDLDDDDIDMDVRRLMRTEYGTVCAAISNELRKVGKRYNLDPVTLYGLVVNELGMTDSGHVNSGALAILKEESILWALQFAGQKTFEKVVSGFSEDALADLADTISNFGNEIEVLDGEIMTAYDNIMYVGNVMDGKWRFAIQNGEVVMSRPIADFIAVPEADESIQIAQYDLNYCDANQYSTILSYTNEKVTFAIGKDSHGHDALRMYNEKGQVFEGKVWAGSFATKDRIGKKQQFWAMAPHFAGTGVVSNVVSAQADGYNGRKYNYALVTMRNFKPAEIEKTEVEPAKFNSANAKTDLSSIFA